MVTDPQTTDLLEKCLRILHGSTSWSVIKNQWPEVAVSEQRRLMEEIIQAVRATTRREVRATIRDVVIDLLASLTAAVSLLKRGSKKAAPSNRMFDQMISDYERSIERGRAAITQDW